MKQLIYQSLGLYLNTLTRVHPQKGGEVGFRLFCKPVRTPLRKHHLDFLQTAQSEDFDFNGINIRLYRWGEGPRKVLFVHGWQSHSYRWKTYINSLSPKDYTLIAFDAPGHGLSGGSQFHVPLNAFLISLLFAKYGGFDGAVAHSIGCFSLMYAIQQYNLAQPEKIVCLAPPGRASEFFDFYSDTLRLNAHTLREVTNQFQMHIRHRVEDVRLRDFAASLSTQGLVVHDRNDPDTHFSNSEELVSVWENSRLVLTEGLGHNLKSKDVMSLVTEFLAK